MNQSKSEASRLAQEATALTEQIRTMHEEALRLRNESTRLTTAAKAAGTRTKEGSKLLAKAMHCLNEASSLVSKLERSNEELSKLFEQFETLKSQVNINEAFKVKLEQIMPESKQPTISGTNAPQIERKALTFSPDINSGIQKWSNSIFRPSIPTNLIAKSVVREIKDERAKLLTAEFLYGERNGTQKEIPYDGSEIKNRIDNLDEESLWLYGGGISEAPTDFSEKSQSKFKIHTGRTRKCPNCKGDGKVDCWHCNGTGQDKSQSCRHCNGRGCHYCNGTGKAKRDCPICKGSGTRQCGKCDGYKFVHTVIEVSTRFRVEDTKEHDYQGQIPPKKLKSTTGAVIFQEVANYPEEGVRGMLKGGIDSQEYTKLQSGIAMVFHSLIDRKIQGYDGNINLVHGLVDNFFKQIPNAFKENCVLEREILPIRLRIRVEDVPVKQVSYTYKEKPYSLWVYGNEQKVYAKKKPRAVTGRLVVHWIIQLIFVGLIFYWFADNHTSNNAAAVNATATAAPSTIVLVSAVTDMVPTNEFRDVVNSVEKLTKNGISETVILSYARDHALIPPLTLEEKNYLAANGVSTNVINLLSHTQTQ